MFFMFLQFLLFLSKAHILFLSNMPTPNCFIFSKKENRFDFFCGMCLNTHRNEKNCWEVISISSSYQDYKYYSILNLINILGPISRTEIATITDYRNGTVGEFVKDMLCKGLIEESGRQSTGSGRSRSMLQISKNLCAIGLSIRAAKYKLVLQPLKGDPIEQFEAPIFENTPEADIIDQIVRDVLALVARHKDLLLVGIGISLPSYNPVMSRQFTLSAAYQHFNDWITVDMANKLEKATGLHVMTFSAVGLPAKAEHLFGSAKGCQNFICVDLSNGIGSSIFCNGNTVVGSDNIAGQIGHTVIDYSACHDTICNCGKPGCMEGFSAWPWLKKSILQAIRSGASSLASSVILERGDKLLASDLRPFIDDGDQVCRFYAKKAAINIGITIANTINICNPERVILYGIMLNLGDYFTNQIIETIKENVLFLSKNFDVVISESFENILPQGAAAEVMSDFLRTHDYQWVYNLNLTDSPAK